MCVCGGNALRSMLLEISPQPGVKMDWDALRKEYVRTVGTAKGKTKASMVAGLQRRQHQSKEAFAAMFAAGASSASSSRVEVATAKEVKVKLKGSTSKNSWVRKVMLLRVRLFAAK